MLTQLDFNKKLDHILEKYKDKNAIQLLKDGNQTDNYSFGDLEDIINNRKKSFEKKGLFPGDRVALIAPHSPYNVINGLSLAYSGMTTVLIDAGLPDDEIKKLITKANVRAILTIESIYKNICENNFNEIPAYDIKLLYGLEAFSDICVDCSLVDKTSDPDEDVIAILFSSGTTDQMKGIMVTYHSVLLARDVFARLAALEDYMSYLLVLPFNHIAGFTGAMTYLLTGCELGFIDNVNSSKLAEGLLRFNPYYFAMVPKVYEVMEQKIRAQVHEKGKVVEIGFNLLLSISGFFRKYLGINIGKKLFKGIVSKVFGTNIFGIGTGASPCKKSTAEFYLNMGLEWANLYATTETSVPIVATGINDRYPNDTIGNVNAHPEIIVKIGKPDSAGVGEILVKSELMMKGYFRNKSLTDSVFDDEGYFKTGDYGYIDKKGYLHMTGRMKESIILQNGKKVSPQDVDDYYLARIEDVDLASKGIKVTDDEYDVIHMFVASENIKNRNIKKEILEISKDAPAMYKISEVHIVSKIPKTTVGKVKRFQLENLGAEEKIDKPVSAIQENYNARQFVIELLTNECPGLPVNMNSHLINDLGIESLKLFEIISIIESKFDVSIAPYMDEVYAVGDLVKLVEDYDETDKNGIDLSIFPVKRTAEINSKFDKYIKHFKRTYEFEIEGMENIPSENVIVSSNHASYLDPFWILIALGKVDMDKVACLAAIHTLEESKDIFEMIGGIPVERTGNTLPAITRVEECLNAGYNVIMFPEGARSRDGSMLPLKSGVSKIAIDTNKKILPIRIDGAFEILPRHKKRPVTYDYKHMRKFKLKIAIKEPISPENKTINELTEILRGAISK